MSHTYQRVVVLLDGSELAEEVLPYVREVIRGRESRVCLLSVAPLVKGIALDMYRVTLPTGSEADVEGQHLEPDLVSYLESVAEQLSSVAADVQVSVRFGRPADEILAFVKEAGADLIAMSTHGRSGISQWVFGSVADRVLRRATCPVLLVRAGHAPLRTSYRRILVPLDGSELAEQALPYVKSLVRYDWSSEDCWESPTIFLISVLATGLGERTVALLTSYPPGLQLTTSALHHGEIQLRTYLRSVATVLRQHGATVQIAIRQGSPADEILAYAAEVDVDLIGMTTHGFSGASRWACGNVAGKVLQGAKTPLLLVRPKFEQGGNSV